MAIPTLGDVRPTRGYDGGPGVSGGNRGHGININGRSNGRQIDEQDSDDNFDQEVNGTNTDPVPPSPAGVLAEGVNQR